MLVNNIPQPASEAHHLFDSPIHCGLVTLMVHEAEREVSSSCAAPRTLLCPTSKEFEHVQHLYVYKWETKPNVWSLMRNFLM